MRKIFLRNALILFSAIILFASLNCGFCEERTASNLVLINGVVIDGTGSAPILNAIIVIKDGKIQEVGKKGKVTIPKDARIIDVKGGTILPAFINTHVHQAYNADNLKAWAWGGVTTVRDESLPGDPVATLQLKTTELNKTEYARIVSSGPMMTKPNGYGHCFVDSPEEARSKTLELINDGVDAIKISMEDGYAGEHGLPKFSPEELKAIIDTAHQHGIPVSAHITQDRYLKVVVEAGVDDVAHIAYDDASEDVMKTMIDHHIFWIPTFTVFGNYGVPLDAAVENLRVFVKDGGLVALGNDYAGGPGKFELGIPMYEITMMRLAKMTPMQIIMASTVNAARVCRREGTLGTLEKGKIADILIVAGDPLKNLNTLKDIQWVLKDGIVIRAPG